MMPSIFLLIILAPVFIAFGWMAKEDNIESLESSVYSLTEYNRWLTQQLREQEDTIRKLNIDLIRETYKINDYWN